MPSDSLIPQVYVSCVIKPTTATLSLVGFSVACGLVAVRVRHSEGRVRGHARSRGRRLSQGRSAWYSGLSASGSRWSTSTCSCATSPCRPSAAVPRGGPGEPVLGAERLRHRLRSAPRCSAGRLADRMGPRTGSSSASSSALSSAWCAASVSVWEAVAARIIQAAGGALPTPASLGLLLAVTSPARRPAAIRGWTAIGGLARRARPGRRRPPGRAELALGVPDQPPCRRDHRGGRLAGAAARARGGGRA